MKEELFLQKYKELENILLKIGIDSVWSFESNIEDPSIKNKMYCCRIMRNYMQHNLDYADFLSINDGMIKFLISMIEEQKCKIVRNKDIMIPLSKLKCAYKDSDIIQTISTMEEYVPVLDEKNHLLGLFTNKHIRQLFLNKLPKNATIGNVSGINIPKTVKFVKSDALAETSLKKVKQASVIYCTNTGTGTGIIEGQLDMKKIENIVI